ncbi:MAG: membrane or secreted protein [Saprospiraceae bacterium]|nr:membrane or secreted protein [Saprospiraceae bacterium]
MELYRSSRDFCFTPPPPAIVQGAWSKTTNQEKQVLLVSGNYFSSTAYTANTGAFLWTKGGTCKLLGTNLVLTYEFDTQDTANVGTSETWKVKLKNGTLTTSANKIKSNWSVMDEITTTPLTAAWLISGRKQNGEISKMDTTRPRKTMKILTGSQFQWIAYNVATKEFFGTGGGSYEAKNGTYKEKIEFFSRDNSRVGTELQFEFKVENDDWHHSGLSSKGEPIYEIWSKRK